METKSEPITRRVISFEAACAECPISKEMEEIVNYSGADRERIFTRDIAQRNHIAKVLKEGWEADYDNSNQEKWYPWFRKTASGFVFACASYDWAHSHTDTGSRLCFPTEELAAFFGTQFIELHNRILSVQ